MNCKTGGSVNVEFLLLKRYTSSLFSSESGIQFDSIICTITYKVVKNIKLFVNFAYNIFSNNKTLPRYLLGKLKSILETLKKKKIQ